MRTYKEVTTTKTVTEKIAVGYKCDCCGKEQETSMYCILMSHNSWGNDSIDSYTTKDYCSLECYAQLAKDFLEDDEYCDYDTSMFDDIEIDKVRALINYKNSKTNCNETHGYSEQEWDYHNNN